MLTDENLTFLNLFLQGESNLCKFVSGQKEIALKSEPTNTVQTNFANDTIWIEQTTQH